MVRRGCDTPCEDPGPRARSEVLREGAAMSGLAIGRRRPEGTRRQPRPNVVEHARHTYEEGELDEAATCRNFRQVRTEGERGVAGGRRRCRTVAR